MSCCGPNTSLSNGKKEEKNDQNGVHASVQVLCVFIVDPLHNLESAPSESLLAGFTLSGTLHNCTHLNKVQQTKIRVP